VPTTWGWGDLDAEEKCPLPTDEQRKKDVREVWFAGDHSDVGGGHGEAESGLAKISLKWMIGEAWGAAPDPESRLLIDERKYRDMFIDPGPGPNATLFKGHDMLADWGLNPVRTIFTIGRWFVDRCPRVELVNCPLPPTRHCWPWPTGRRKISDSRRKGQILIHESVLQVYVRSKEQLCNYWKRTGRLPENIDSNDIHTATTTEVVQP